MLCVSIQIYKFYLLSKSKRETTSHITTIAKIKLVKLINKGTKYLPL